MTEAERLELLAALLAERFGHTHTRADLLPGGPSRSAGHAPSHDE